MTKVDILEEANAWMAREIFLYRATNSSAKTPAAAVLVGKLTLEIERLRQEVAALKADRPAPANGEKTCAPVEKQNSGDKP